MAVKPIRLSAEDIEMGKPLPWSVFDRTGKLLLKKGTVIANINVDRFCHRGVFRVENVVNNEGDTKPKEKVEEKNPFVLYKSVVKAYPNIVEQIITDQKVSLSDVTKLCIKIHKLCHLDVDAALGIVHFIRESAYSTIQPIHVAMLCEIIASETEHPKDKMFPLLAAALTANVSMYKYHDRLNHQRTPLSAKQITEIRQHPEDSVALLTKAGVTIMKNVMDPVILND